MPPEVLARRVADETERQIERVRGPLRARALTPDRLAAQLGSPDVNALWEELAQRPYAALADGDAVRAALPDDVERIEKAAREAAGHRVDLLGSGVVDLGSPINWHRDFKSGREWPRRAAPTIRYAELGESSDVKVPWELSRFQWALPLGQAFALTRDESTAAAARALLEDWIEANPYGTGVNWACTMDVALRILSWTFLFHTCARSDAWRDEGFRGSFLRMLYLLGDWTSRHLERGEVNGNHYTSDAAGLVFAGLFFGERASARRWSSTGWQILVDELPRQVTPDGVDFEMSTAYHRLVTELFLLPALYRRSCGLPVPSAYVSRLVAMATFAAAYTRVDGSSPLWGDADDARALPLGRQGLHDHRYLARTVGTAFDHASLALLGGPDVSETVWLLGAAGAKSDDPPTESVLFRDGGVAVLRSARDHVFIDAGPVGLAGRGGHGHNDCLAFEAWLDGHLLICDAGSYVYTSSVEWRNRFRSTSFHNTPQVDGLEVNRFLGDEHLWTLSNDARPTIEGWDTESHTLTASHDGYTRLEDPLVVRRTLKLTPTSHMLEVRDEFECRSDHEVQIALTVAPDVTVEQRGDTEWLLSSEDAAFTLTARGEGWRGSVEPGWVSPSYGVKLITHRIVLRGSANPVSLTLAPKRG